MKALHAIDALVKEFRATRPDSGRRYAMGHLRSKGIRIQRDRPYRSLKRLDSLGCMPRARVLCRSWNRAHWDDCASESEGDDCTGDDDDENDSIPAKSRGRVLESLMASTDPKLVTQIPARQVKLETSEKDPSPAFPHCPLSQSSCHYPGADHLHFSRIFECFQAQFSSSFFSLTS